MTVLAVACVGGPQTDPPRQPDAGRNDNDEPTIADAGAYSGGGADASADAAGVPSDIDGNGEFAPDAEAADAADASTDAELDAGTDGASDAADAGDSDAGVDAADAG